MRISMAGLAGAALALAACQAPAATTVTAPPSTATTTTTSAAATAMTSPTTARPTPSATSSATAAKPSTSTTVAPPTSVSARPSGGGGGTEQACLDTVNLCLDLARGMTKVPLTEKAFEGFGLRSAQGDDLITVAKTESGIGGGCNTNEAPTVVRSIKVMAVLPESNTGTTTLYAVQAIVPEENGTYRTFTTLSNAQAATSVGEKKACSLNFVNFAGLTMKEMLHFTSSTDVKGVSKADAQSALESKDALLAFEVLTLAHPKP